MRNHSSVRVATRAKGEQANLAELLEAAAQVSK
jgi:hypothetical protein